MGAICDFDALLTAADGRPPLRAAVVGAADPSVLAGMAEAAEAGYLDPVLVGRPEEVAAAAEEAGIDATAHRLVAAGTEEDQAAAGVELVTSGEVGGLVKGHVHTAAFLHPVVGRLRTDRRMSHVFVLELPTYPKLLSVTDAAVNIAPDLRAKAAITANAIGLARRFGLPTPKVAVLSAVETVNPDIASSVEAAALAKMADRGQITGAVVDGPLAFDVAISAESARVKGLDSPVAGDVDVLVVPDIDAGNILVKDLEHLAGATLAGVVLGATVPVVLTSRSDPPRARLLSCALAALLADGDDGTGGGGPAPA